MIADATRAERGHRTLEGGMQDLRWSIRSLRASAGFTALAVCTLTLGIGATTVAFTVLDTVLLRPLPYANAGQLVLIRERTDKQALLPPSYPNFASWRDGARSFDGVASATYPSSRTVLPTNTAADPLRVQAMGVSRRFFAILGVAPAVGREFTDDENRLGGSPAVMVSYELWQSQLGGRLPLGSITWSDSPTPVVGVLPPGFTFVSPADVYFPHERAPGTVRSAHSYLVVARLRHGVSLATARADMSALSRSLLGQFGMQTQAADADIIPLRDYLVSDYRTLLAIVFGAAALVLLIACTNLMSAQLARGRAREREVVIRAALGASRARLIRQLLFESGAVVALGTSFATLLALGATKAIKTAGKSLLPRLNELALDVRVLAFVAAVATLTVLLVGVYPAVRLANRDAGLALRAGRDTSMSVRASVWRLLVGFEIALAVVLVVGSSLLIKTLHNILTANTGFDAHG
ncbi:MAG TPA: ABC transporter permease, partial [Gemmatimonadaceae bacterium]|nr:ABC transporter permease [Gemmatimonadaceae bacterium]